MCLSAESVLVALMTVMFVAMCVCVRERERASSVLHFQAECPSAFEEHTTTNELESWRGRGRGINSNGTVAATAAATSRNASVCFKVVVVVVVDSTFFSFPDARLLLLLTHF